VKKIVLSILGCAILGFFSLLALSIWAMNSHGFDKGSFERLAVGMTMEDVKRILGKPSIPPQSTEDSGVVWTYGHDLKWCMAQLEFDFEGILKEKTHDH
jgi:outer membrane protein assembly factor BamE (lipoprotein component of BamABCDE complex)